jgi:cytochrome d ubiquinol oxidase subunit II
MSIVALIFLPIILIYQAWSYWIFRKRLETKVDELTY